MGQYAKFAIGAGQALSGLSGRNSSFEEARLLKRRAGQTRASAQRGGEEDRREARLLISTARARLAAGGGNASDESIVNVLAEIEAQGEMNALTRLHDGEVEAESDEASAVISRNQGRAQGGAGVLAGIGSSFAGKYG